MAWSLSKHLVSLLIHAAKHSCRVVMQANSPNSIHWNRIHEKQFQSTHIEIIPIPEYFTGPDCRSTGMIEGRMIRLVSVWFHVDSQEDRWWPESVVWIKLTLWWKRPHSISQIIGYGQTYPFSCQLMEFFGHIFAYLLLENVISSSLSPPFEVILLSLW